MTTTTIQANGINYLFSPDDSQPRASRQWMLVRARLVNDVTLRPVTNDVRVESDLPLTTPRIADDGLVGLVGVPRTVFPILAGRQFVVNLTLRAKGFLSQTLAVIIPTDAKLTAGPGPVIGDRVITLNNAVNVQPGEFLMIGNPITSPGSVYEEVQVIALGPAANQVTIKTPLRLNHNVVTEPVIPVIASNFAPADAGDVLMVPQP